MSLDKKFLASLICPENRDSLTLANSEFVDQVNAKITNEGLENRSGHQVTEQIDGALIRADGEVAYLIIDSIPNLIAADGILIKSL